MKIDELKVRNTSKKNIRRNSKQAEQYDFLVKTGIKQDDIEFMSIFDTPVPFEGTNISLGDYINKMQETQAMLNKKFDTLNRHYVELNKKYEEVEGSYKKILEKGLAEYIKVLANL